MIATSAYRQQAGWRHRVPALLLSLAAVGLIVLALLRLGLLPGPDQRPDSRLTTFNVTPPAPVAGTPDRSASATEPAAPGAAPRPVPAPAEREPPVAPSPPLPATPFPDMLILTRDQYARSDIGKLPATGTGAGEAASGSGPDTASVYGPGEGPGGERLFNAQWYREPSNAELTGYLPPSGAPPGSWATIACRAADDYRVENCRALDESPVGSGLARAMRQAAWQFRVRPPRIGGRPQLGAWVRIRIDFTRAR